MSTEYLVLNWQPQKLINQFKKMCNIRVDMKERDLNEI